MAARGAADRGPAREGATPSRVRTRRPPDSTRLLSACADTSALVWDLGAVRAKLAPPPPGVDAPWDALGDENAEKAYEAILALAADPARCVVLMRERLAPVAPPDEKLL